MELFALSMALPLGLLFLASGLIINIAQLITLLLLLPVSRNAYRRVNILLSELLWSELVWLVDWWAGVKIQFFVDSEDWKHAGKEHALVICNHRSDIDWLIGWVAAHRVGCLGSTRALMKKSTKFLPVIGWSMWFSEYTFLARNWAKDEKLLKSSFQQLHDFPRPFWMALFVEGTRFTESKLRRTQDYAASEGLPVPRNVLVPKTKGFVSAIQNLRPFVPAVYDLTITFPKETPSPTMMRLLRGQSSVVHLLFRRYPMADLPDSEDGIAQWCREIFVLKDDLLERHKELNTFGEELRQDILRSIKSLLIIIGWSIMILNIAARLFKPLISTWVGVAWVTGGLFTVLLLMQIFILFSQSERSTPAKVVPRNNGRENIEVDGKS